VLIVDDDLRGREQLSPGHFGDHPSSTAVQCDHRVMTTACASIDGVVHVVLSVVATIARPAVSDVAWHN
jgi:hypothetical protein